MGSTANEAARIERASTVNVRRRQVFYIPGYDPFHPRRYRELYRKECAAQAAISGYEIGLSPGAVVGQTGWQVQATIDGQAVEAKIEVLVWSDLVKASMQAGIVATYLALVRTAWLYVSSGALFRLMRLRKGPVIAALYPVLALSLQAGLALALAVIVAALVRAGMAGVLPMSSNPEGISFGTVLPISVAAAAGGGTAWTILTLFKRWDAKLYAYYLMQDYSYSARFDGAYPPELDRRLDHFAHRVAQACKGDVDEVLLVGHSSGAHLAISVLARVLRRAGPVHAGPALALLTLGQVVPMVSFLPKAVALRRDLRDLSHSSRLTWVDVSAPGDGCAFALCDPVAVSGVAPHQGKRWPLVFSAAFRQTLSAARWQALRWRFFRLHFQYICAFDAPKDYDYFQITAGPQTLATRYAGRAASKSRRVASLNRYPSLS